MLKAMNQTDMLRLESAHQDLWHNWWPALEALYAEELNRDVGGSFASVLQTVAHMVGAERSWKARILGQTPAGPPTNPTLAELKLEWQHLADWRKAYLQQTPPEQVSVYPMVDGATAHNRLDEVLLHLISHAHFHRGQLATQFRLLGLKPPSRHFIGFFRDNSH